MSSKPSPAPRRSTAGKRGAYRPLPKTPGRNWLQPLRVVGLALVWLVALAAGLAVSVYGYQKLDAPVAEIAVTGDLKHVTEKQIESWVSGQLEGGFFSLDMDLLCAELEARPWIASVSARRQWPDRLLLRIEEEVPVARWGEAQFINQHGEVLPEMSSVDVDTDLDRLPHLLGPEGQQMTVMAAYARFATVLNAAGAGLRQLTMDKRGGWALQLGEGAELVLGRDQLDLRLQHFLVLWQQELMARRNELVRVDARYNKGLAVQWKPAGINENGSEFGNEFGNELSSELSNEYQQKVDAG
ncbi:MAG: cell division protein FtsQ/DivIB [Porticoccaceae bacterium]